MIALLLTSLLLVASAVASVASEADPKSQAASQDMGDREASRAYAGDDAESGWEYDPYYIFPLTRHMEDSGLPFYAQIALYPLAFALDLGQWPVGALAGLAGK
jgi:hypothetical protein